MKAYVTILVLIIVVLGFGYLWQKPHVDCWYKKNYTVIHDAVWTVKDGKCIADGDFPAPPSSDIRVSNFEECVEAGNPVMESHPRQCRHNGETFVEEIMNTGISLSECDAFSKIDLCPEFYSPICAKVEVQCVTEPCNPVSQTYSNICDACRALASGQNIVSLEDGACQ